MGRSNGQATPNFMGALRLLRPNERAWEKERPVGSRRMGPSGVAPHPCLEPITEGRAINPARCNTLKRTEMCRPKLWDLTVPPEAGTGGKQSCETPQAHIIKPPRLKSPVPRDTNPNAGRHYPTPNSRVGFKQQKRAGLLYSVHCEGSLPCMILSTASQRCRSLLYKGGGGGGGDDNNHFVTDTTEYGAALPTTDKQLQQQQQQQLQQQMVTAVDRPNDRPTD